MTDRFSVTYPEVVKSTVRKNNVTSFHTYGRSSGWASRYMARTGASSDAQECFFLNAALEGQLQAYLDADERKGGMPKNGKNGKALQTSDGPFEIEKIRDRNATFEPELIKEHETVPANTLNQKS